MSEEKTILLTKIHYVHIIDNNSGNIRLIEGPYAGNLRAHESIHGMIMKKIVLGANHDMIIKNPVEEGGIQQGKRVVRKGPMMFSLHPGEEIDTRLRAAIILTKNNGVYIRNSKTGDVRLEIGPQRIFLSVDEELYEKELTHEERVALYIDANHKNHEAVAVDLQKDDIIQLYDKDKSRIVKGPKRVFLQPHERPKIFNLAGGTPKRPGVVIRAKISTSPSFITDILSIRTKDNAILKLRVRYKQRILVEEGKLERIFSINDFIGFAVETLASEIREEAAKYDFEDFHSNAATVIKSAIFTGNVSSRVFENGLEIYGVDIKEITPQDEEIAKKLNAAISKNMDIYVEKILQEAELEARQQLIEGEKDIEELRQSLIELQNSNNRMQQIERAKITAEANVLESNGKSKAQSLLRNAEKEVGLDKIQKIQDVMNISGSEKYLKLQEYLRMGVIPKRFVLSTESELSLPIDEKETHK